MKTSTGWILVIAVVGLAIFLFSEGGSSAPLQAVSTDTSNAYAPRDTPAPAPLPDTAQRVDTAHQRIHTGNVSPQQVVDFAQTLTGTPYRYASADPALGFDCSGFITYVFHHFNIEVPRSSIDFTNMGKEVDTARARAGDIILFTGTDSTEKFVGHMGLVVANEGGMVFIHSSSGKAHGVTVTPLNDYYRSRFVKTIRIFE